MGLEPPTESELAELSEELHLDLDRSERSDFAALLEDTLELYDIVEKADVPADTPAVDRPIVPGRRATDDDPNNAWITRCDVELPDATGPLDGWRIGLKDNVALAGVEMTCGSTVMEGYEPRVDAAIVTRLLEAGGRIVGKNNMDDMAFAANGSSSAFGPTLNPHDADHLAGGSTAGGAAAVATGEVRLAIGTDQGGSVRAPASWSGVVGLKPSFGLVPYTGVIGLRHPVDHVGTLTESAADAARVLSVLAGRDGRDSRQPNAIPDVDYAAALEDGIDDRRIAVVEEGFDRETTDSRVTERVRATLDAIADRGAIVESISVPSYKLAPAVYTLAMLEGLVATVRGEGIGYNHSGWHDDDWMSAFGERRRRRGGKFPPTLKLGLLVGAYASEETRSKYYAKAVNMMEAMTEEYDTLFDSYDLLAMPTTPGTAQEHDPSLGRVESVARAWTSLANAGIFNVTGHPAASVPAGQVDGLPVGLQFVGDQFDDATVLAAVRGVESGQ